MLRWAAVLGITGFLFGFLGPMALAPDANQGPLLGIFITGPAGALLGAVLGLAISRLNVSRPTATRCLYVLVAAMAAATLYVSIPPPRYEADVVDGEIRRCTSAQTLKKTTIAHLNDVTAAHPPLSKSIQWDSAFDQALARMPGVILDVHVSRTTALYENDAPWNRGTRFASPWHPTDAELRYFASYPGDDCARYMIDGRSLYSVTGHVQIWPPSYLPEMLDLKVAQPWAASRAALPDDTGPVP